MPAAAAAATEAPSIAQPDGPERASSAACEIAATLARAANISSAPEIPPTAAVSRGASWISSLPPSTKALNSSMPSINAGSSSTPTLNAVTPSSPRSKPISIRRSRAASSWPRVATAEVSNLVRISSGSVSICLTTSANCPPRISSSANACNSSGSCRMPRSSCGRS